MKSEGKLGPAIGLVILLTALPLMAYDVDNLDRAVELAIEQDSYIFMKVGVDWSKESVTFDKALEENPDIRDVLKENLILCKIDADTDWGKQLAKFYRVKNFPTFILLDSNREQIDRWHGFGCQECFVKRLKKTMEEPLTLAQRMKKFSVSPTAADAFKIGEFRHNEGLFAEAVAYYSRARDLDPQAEINYDAYIFGAMAYGNYFQIFTADQVKEQADRIISSGKADVGVMMKISYSMAKIAKRMKDDSYFLPYLKNAIEETDGVDDIKVQKMRNELMPEYLVKIARDAEKAVALKRTIQPENWQENADLLNNFAWWCFENQVNLREAEKLSRKAIEIAKPGKQKGNILDTLAEIRNARGDLDDAVKYLKLALKEVPDSDYFKKQLQRFQKLSMGN